MTTAMKIYRTHTKRKISKQAYVVFYDGVERVSLPNNEGQDPTCYEQQEKLKQTQN